VRCNVAHQDDCFVKLSLADPALKGLSEGSHVYLRMPAEQLRVFI